MRRRRWGNGDVCREVMPVGEDVEEFGPAEEEKEGERPDVSLEEGQKPRIRKSMPMPTQAEVDEHMATHPIQELVCTLCRR